ncbi:UPF0481 protein At3g47200-like [Cornus florida]|uniref:UPF0481 protein At3g47200-like n=1 Tax=Cornus florida TaxID=4283 RepID=UPI00289BDEA9|nr:UPF0481 protein At3g47200-like [Cornus florida]
MTTVTRPGVPIWEDEEAIVALWDGEEASCALSKDEEVSLPSLKDEVVSTFLKSVEIKINCSEKNEVMMDRVPDMLRQQNEKAYSPTTISIGPLHRGTESLQAMEPVKSSYTRVLLNRAGTFEETKRACAVAMLEMEDEVRKYYEPARLQSCHTEDESKLAEVMLIDGCFIIELLFRNGNKDNDDDPILGNSFKYYAIQRDLLLLENQIPFAVLQQLFRLTVGNVIPNPNDQKSSLTRWVLVFFGNIMGLEKNEYKEDETPYHILHLLHMQYLPVCTPYLQKDKKDDETKKMENKENQKMENKEKEKMENRISYPATQLQLAGVELKAGAHGNLFDIKFSTTFSFTSCSSLFRKGRLEITPFLIFDSTESFLRNCIALEQSYSWIGNYFTSLAFLMDILIDTAEDVELLEEAGIIRNNLGSREEVAKLFNGICKNAIPRRFHYRKEYKDVMKFCNPWRLYSRRLTQYYFGSPWSGISVVAALILFALTFLSTLYTLLAYY